MQIQIGTNPNCSEATLRILTDGQDAQKVSDLFDKLYLELNKEPYDKDARGTGEWDDEILKPEFDWSEGYIINETVFGLECMKISGDAPYNFAEEMMQIINRYLPDARREWSEP